MRGYTVSLEAIARRNSFTSDPELPPRDMKKENTFESKAPVSSAGEPEPHLTMTEYHTLVDQIDEEWCLSRGGTEQE